jgi:hypothetical protein
VIREPSWRARPGVVGEALDRLTREDPDLAARIPDIARIVAFPNVLAHGDDAVDDEVVWKAITIDLPGLTANVEALLKELDTRGTPGQRPDPGIEDHLWTRAREWSGREG